MTKENESLPNRRILFITSTFPSSETDPVPAFVRDEAIWINKIYGYKIDVLAPHNAYSKTTSFQSNEHFNEYRFHYFFPFRWELLAGRGIEPALRKNRLLYLQLPPFFLFEFIAIFRLARLTKPDALYAHWFTPQAIMSYIVSKILGIPFVFDSQASDIIVLKKIPFAKNIVAAVCKNAVAYTVPSKMTADKLEYFTNDKNRKDIMKKLSIIPMGTEFKKPSQKNLTECKKQVNPDSKKTILFMGRLVDRKGVHTLIKAFSEISSKFPDYILLIAGDGQEAKTLKELARSSGVDDKVNFLGYVTGQMKNSLLSFADIYVLPSINIGDQAEGLPIAFMEAVSAGKVTVISDATGAHEIAEDSKNTFIFQAGSVKELANKLSLAMSMTNKERTMFVKNTVEFSKRFQWESIIRERVEALKLKF